MYIYIYIAEEFGQTFKIEFENVWKRFLDDCFLLWSKSEDDLRKLHSILNDLHEDINFTMETSNVELPFLDVKVKM